jgi:hypothetical protein
MPSKAQRTLLTKKRRETFLSAISSGATVQEACQAAGFSKQFAYAEAKRNPEFNEAWESANDDKKEIFEKELARRALGYERPLTFKGLRTGQSVTEHSDLLLMFLLKKLDPSYRDQNKVELNVQGDRLGELADAISGKAEEFDPVDVPEKGSSAE